MENISEEQKAIFEKEIQLAKEEIQLILKKYNVALLPIITHIGSNVQSSVDIVKLKAKPEEVQAEVQEEKSEE